MPAHPTAHPIVQPTVGRESAAASARIRDRVFGTTAHAAGPILRLTLAVVMFPHGAQKVLGWFGGHGLAATLRTFTEQMGLPAAVAVFVVVTELLGSLALAVGLATRVAALGFVALMTGAILTVHARHGFFMNWQGQQQGEGFEYHLLVIGIALALLIAGAGRMSVDRRIASR